METRDQIAIERFNNGFNCAQSVISSFSDVIDIHEKELLRLSHGFGGGIGKLQETCGAVTGAVMVIGALKKFSNEDDLKKHPDVYKLTQEFVNEFQKQNGSYKCLELLNCNLNTPEGIKVYTDGNYKVTKCSEYIKSAVKILEDFIKNNK